MPTFPGAAVLDAVSDVVVVVDHGGRVIYRNPAAQAAMHGEAESLPIEGRRLIASARQAGQAVEATADGWWRRVTLDAAGTATLIARPQAVCPQDVALQQAEIRIRELFEHAPTDMLVLQVSPDGPVTIEKPNAAFCRTTGLAAEAISLRRLDEALDAKTAEILAADARICIAQGGFECQNSLTFPVGQLLVKAYYRPMLDSDGAVPRVLLTQIDLTENRRIEAALRQALRLEVVGQLTGGVAHEFNNLLTAVVGSLELLGRTMVEPRQGRWIKVATEAAQRGATLTHQLLSYARKQFLAPTATNIPQALGGMTALIRGSLGSRIALETAFDERTWLAHTDIAQLELALLNLMVNARAAMPQGGRLMLSTRNHALGAPGLPTELEPGGYVVVTVADTGIGMPPEILAHAMEPFFTTKGIGEGSGLGLSQAYGFARQLGGTLRLTSAPGAGTVAEIFLPRAPRPHGKPVRVLLVDDNHHVRTAAAALLRGEGWVVDEASDAAAAEEHLATWSYAVLLADVERSGVQLARRAQALQPQLRAIFLTVGADPAVTAGLPGPVVAKRMLAEDLVATVQGVLASA